MLAVRAVIVQSAFATCSTEDKSEKTPPFYFLTMRKQQLAACQEVCQEMRAAI
jgi:hypothetical protein